MDEYLKIVSQLPLPTVEQTEAFAKYVTRAHSWYKHLPPFPPGRLFAFFLDPQAGRSIGEQSGPDEFHGMVVRDISKHPSLGPFTTSKTDGYRREFGFWNYQNLLDKDRRKTPVRVFRAEAVNLDPERENWLEVGLPVELPSELLEPCSCRLTAFITGGVLQRTSMGRLREWFADLERYLKTIPDSPHLARCRQVRADLDNFEIFSRGSHSTCQISVGKRTWKISPTRGGQPHEFELPGFAEEQSAQQQERLRETLLRTREMFSRLSDQARGGVVSSGTSPRTIPDQAENQGPVQSANITNCTDEYIKLVSQLPLPTVEQTLAFANYVVAARSQDNHLPLFPPGIPVVFYLDPQAGRALKRRVVSTIPWRRNPPSRYTRLAFEIEDSYNGRVATHSYLKKFGHWQCAVDPRKDPEIYSVERVEQLEGCNPAFEVALAVPVPDYVLQNNSCPLNVFIQDCATSSCSLEELGQFLKTFDANAARMPGSPQIQRFQAITKAFRVATNYSGCARQVVCHVRLGLDERSISVTEKVRTLQGQEKWGREATFRFDAGGEIGEERAFQHDLLRKTLLRARDFFSEFCSAAARTP